MHLHYVSLRNIRFVASKTVYRRIIFTNETIVKP